MDNTENITEQILFDDILPLPFRVLILVQTGTFAWLLINYICFNQNLNIAQLLNLSYSSHNYGQLDHFNTNASGEFASTIPADMMENKTLMSGIWHNLRSITIFNCSSWLFFKIIQHHYAKSETPNEIIKWVYYVTPLIACGYTVYILFFNRSKNASQGQRRIFTTMKRILLGGINSKTMRTNDILISDSLISYARVINDFALFVWVYYIDETYNPVVELLVLSLPACIRMKQCWNEFKLTRSKQHLFNFLKYLTSIFPISVNYIIKVTMVKNPDVSVSTILKLNQWWFFFSFVNSSYSFFWDIKMDWGFELFDNLFSKNKKLVITRANHKLAFSTNLVYYFAIVNDFVLRFIWVIKIFIIKQEVADNDWTYVRMFSTFLYGYDVYSLGYTVLELLEIFRRWVWCFIKLENDWVKLQAADELEMVDIKNS